MPGSVIYFLKPINGQYLKCCILFPFQVIIPECRYIDDSVLSLHATDKDSEHNGKIFYRMISASDTFFIDPQNGEHA